MKPLNALDNKNKITLSHILIWFNFKPLLPPIVAQIKNNAPPHISESHHYDDESFYENMVDEMYNPTNYEFAIVVIIQRSFSLPISDHISIHAQRHA